MRAGATALIVLSVPIMAALPVLGHAQSPTATRGAFGGSLSTDATPGALRGAVPVGATVGAARGAVPVDAMTGAVRGAPPSGGTVGAFRSVPVSGGAVSVLPGAFLPMTTGALRGDVPVDASVGTVSVPIPSGTSFGGPGPAEFAQGLKSQARSNLVDGNYVQGETMLRRSVANREQVVGSPVHPEVAAALDDNAKVLRHWNREAAAADMEARAKEIRIKLEPPAPKKPDRF
jgi:hypothetical protein